MLLLQTEPTNTQETKSTSIIINSNNNNKNNSKMPERRRTRRRRRSEITTMTIRTDNQLTHIYSKKYRSSFTSSTSTFSSSKPKCSKFIFISSLLCLPTLLLSTLITSSQYGDCAKLPDIYWNSSNPIFRIDNTDHIFDVNKKQHDHDQVDIVCPQATPGDKSLSSPANATATLDQERYIIYSVSKEEYDTCRINGRGRIAAVCNSEPDGKRAGGPPITITFRSFTPQPNGLEFAAGQDYYFITALYGPQMDQQKRMSPCREHNMKVIFKVCCKSSTTSSVSNQSSKQGSLANLLPRPSPQPAAIMPSQTRRPPVITVRPTLPVQRVTGSSINDINIQSFFEPNTLFGSSTVGQSQPITVLPIEVLSTSSTSASSDQLSNDLSSPPSSPSGSSSDLPLAEQPQTPASLPPPPPPTPQPARLNPHPRHQQQHHVPQQHQPAPFQRVPMIPFNPRESPDNIRAFDRWAPTPLPGDFHQKLPRLLHVNSQQQQQQQQQEQQQQLSSGWPSRYAPAAQHNPWSSSSSSSLSSSPSSIGQAHRGQLYWSTYKPSYIEPPLRGQPIGIQQQLDFDNAGGLQTSGSGKTTTTTLINTSLAAAASILLTSLLTITSLDLRQRH